MYKYTRVSAKIIMVSILLLCFFAVQGSVKAGKSDTPNVKRLSPANDYSRCMDANTLMNTIVFTSINDITNPNNLVHLSYASNFSATVVATDPRFMIPGDAGGIIKYNGGKSGNWTDNFNWSGGPITINTDGSDNADWCSNPPSGDLLINDKGSSLANFWAPAPTGKAMVFYGAYIPGGGLGKNFYAYKLVCSYWDLGGQNMIFDFQGVGTPSGIDTSIYEPVGWDATWGKATIGSDGKDSNEASTVVFLRYNVKKKATEMKPIITVNLNDYEKYSIDPAEPAPVRLGVNVKRIFDNNIDCNNYPNILNGSNGLEQLIDKREGFPSSEPPGSDNALDIGVPEPIRVAQTDPRVCEYNIDGVGLGYGTQWDNLKSFLNSKPVGHSYKLAYKYTTPNGLSDDKEGTGHVFEVPYIVFAGNDLKACSNAYNNRFSFVKDASMRGSYSEYASIWRQNSQDINNTITGYIEPGSQDYTTGLTTIKNGLVNTLKNLNPDCNNALAEIPGQDDLNNVESNISGDYNGVNKQINRDGNIKITDDITTSDSSGAYWIKAKNIYINKNVEILKNVILIADNIYTCSDNGIPVPQTELEADCSKKLEIEGVVSAKKLFLTRSTGTRYQFTGDGKNNASEVITYPASFYFNNINDSASSNKGSIQYYKQVAPRL